MRWVVVRPDKYIVVTNTSRKRAEELLKKYMNIKKRWKLENWLRQWGIVLRFPFYYTFDESLVGVYTPYEFLEKYRQFMEAYAAEEMEKIEGMKNRYERAAEKRKITLFRKWFREVEEAALHAKITRERLERIERGRRAVMLLAIPFDRNTMRNLDKALYSGEVHLMPGMYVGVAEFKNTVWLYVRNGINDVITALIVKKNAGESTIANAAGKVIEEWKDDADDWNHLRHFLRTVGKLNCELLSNPLKCHEIVDKASLAYTMLRLLAGV